MGSIVGGLIGGVGSIIGAGQQAKAASKAADAQIEASKIAADASLKGFNYLTEGPGAAAMQGYVDAGQQAIPAQQTTQNVQAQLLGLPAPYMTTPAPAPEAQPGGQTGGSGSEPSGGRGLAGEDPAELRRAAGIFGGMAGLAGASDGAVQDVQNRFNAGATQSEFRRGAQASADAQGGPMVTDQRPPQQQTSPQQAAPQASTPQQASTLPATQGATAQPVGGVGAEGAKSAFDTYRDSTGYQFRRDQGTQAINANVGAAGLRHSGGTLKALQEHGQNIGSQEFGNYLGQLQGLNAQQSGLAQGGQNALNTIGSVGSSAGSSAGSAIMSGAQGAGQARMQGANAMAGGIAGAASNFGSAIGGAMNQFGGGNNLNRFPPAPVAGGGLY